MDKLSLQAETEREIKLDERCYCYSGSKYDTPDQYCNNYNGLGFILTRDGEVIMDLVKRHLIKK